jgi:hypothetical protein
MAAACQAHTEKQIPRLRLRNDNNYVTIDRFD